MNPFKPFNSSFQLIVGKFSRVFIIILSGNSYIAILLIDVIVIF